MKPASRDLRTCRDVDFLAAQGILTYCTNRTLTYHLYADGSGLFVLAALSTPGSLPKILFRQAAGRAKALPFLLLWARPAANSCPVQCISLLKQNRSVSFLLCTKFRFIGQLLAPSDEGAVTAQAVTGGETIKQGKGLSIILSLRLCLAANPPPSSEGGLSAVHNCPINRN